MTFLHAHASQLLPVAIGFGVGLVHLHPSNPLEFTHFLTVNVHLTPINKG